MRTTHWLFALALLVPASLVACKTPAEKEQDAREAQDKANVTITQAQVDLDKKENKAIANAASTIQGAQDDANKKIQNAVEKADKKTMEADLALAKDKTEFKNLTIQKVADLKKRRDTLEEECSHSSKINQVDARAALDDIDAKLMTAHNDLLVVDSAGTQDFENAEIRVNQDLTDIRKSMDDLDKRR